MSCDNANAMYAARAEQPWPYCAVESRPRAKPLLRSCNVSQAQLLSSCHPAARAYWLSCRQPAGREPACGLPQPSAARYPRPHPKTYKCHSATLQVYNPQSADVLSMSCVSPHLSSRTLSLSGSAKALPFIPEAWARPAAAVHSPGAPAAAARLPPPLLPLTALPRKERWAPHGSSRAALLRPSACRRPQATGHRRSGAPPPPSSCLAAARSWWHLQPGAWRPRPHAVGRHCLAQFVRFSTFVSISSTVLLGSTCTISSLKAGKMGWGVSRQ